MTRSTQKQEEYETLLALLSAIGIRPASSPLCSEAPDFAIRILDRTVGVEATMYHSDKTVAGVRRRVVESEWEAFERASQEFRKGHAELNDLYILFRWKSTVPPRAKRAVFFQEILEFARSQQHTMGTEYAVFSGDDFTTPLMLEYLKGIGGIVLRRGNRDDWDSNTTGGFVDHPALGVSRIVKSKSAKKYRKEVVVNGCAARLDELWLVIQGTHRPSETVLPFNDASEFNESRDLQKNLAASPFAKVYVFTAMGLFEWDKKYDRWQAQRGRFTI